MAMDTDTATTTATTTNAVGGVTANEGVAAARTALATAQAS